MVIIYKTCLYFNQNLLECQRKIKIILIILKQDGACMKQLRKRFNEERVKELLKKYEDSAVKLEIICDIVGVARTQFFCLLKQYRQNKLSLSYTGFS